MTIWSLLLGLNNVLHLFSVLVRKSTFLYGFVYIEVDGIDLHVKDILKPIGAPKKRAPEGALKHTYRRSCVETLGNLGVILGRILRDIGGVPAGRGVDNLLGADLTLAVGVTFNPLGFRACDAGAMSRNLIPSNLTSVVGP